MTFSEEFRLICCKYVFQPISLHFGWRNAFKDLSSSVAHCITIAVEDFSTKILQHEQKEGYSMSLVNNRQMRESCGAVQEEEQPKRIAKAGIKRSEV